MPDTNTSGPMTHPWRLGVLAALVVALAGSWAWAERGDGKQRRQHNRTRPAATQPDEQNARGKRAERRAERREKMRQRIQQRLFDGVDLTDDQKKQVRAAFKNHHEKVRAWHDEHSDEMRQLKQDMRAAYKAADREKMKQLRQRAHALMQSRPMRVALFADIKEILSDEQWKTLNDNRSEMREKVRKHRPGPRGKMHRGKRDDKERRGDRKGRRDRPNKDNAGEGEDDEQMDL